jgi:hypothetical protein
MPARTAVLAASAPLPSGPASETTSTAMATIAQVRRGLAVGRRAESRSITASNAQPASAASRLTVATAPGPTGRTVPPLSAAGSSPATGSATIQTANAAAVAPATTRPRRVRARPADRDGAMLTSDSMVMAVPSVR